MPDLYEQHLMSMPAVEFKQECLLRIFRARTATGRSRRENMRREGICAGVAARRGYLDLWRQALETVNGALAPV